tara:strand:+ start:3271 stop:3678 length:408 start_codon:yes stop_codon:yes gene_type:complete
MRSRKSIDYLQFKGLTIGPFFKGSYGGARNQQCLLALDLTDPLTKRDAAVKVRLKALVSVAHKICGVDANTASPFDFADQMHHPAKGWAVGPQDGVNARGDAGPVSFVIKPWLFAGMSDQVAKADLSKRAMISGF